MRLPLFFPPCEYVQAQPPAVELASRSVRLKLTIRDLCAHANVQCQASGAWTEREVCVESGGHTAIHRSKDVGRIQVSCSPRSPGGGGAVKISVPSKYGTSTINMARYALGALAYAVHDPVARQSIKGQSWACIDCSGRPRKARALTSAERQARHRRRLARPSL